MGIAALTLLVVTSGKSELCLSVSVVIVWAPTDLLQAADVGLQWQALRALVALQDATCSLTEAVLVLMLDVSHMMQEPSMKHQKLPRHLTRLPSFLHPLLHGSKEVSQVGISLHQPKNAPVESLFEDGHRKLVPRELVRHRKQAHKLPEVRYSLLAPHLLVRGKDPQLLLDGIAEAGTPAFEHEPRSERLRELWMVLGLVVTGFGVWDF